MKHQSNQEIKEQYRKRYQENPELHIKNKKIKYHKCQEKKKKL